MIDDWKEVERYATAKPPKDLWGLYESQVRKSTLFSLFFVRAVRGAANTGMVIPIVGLVWNGVMERSGVNFAGFRPRTARGNACGVSPPHGERECLRGFAPARRDPFVSAKGSKTMGAQARPFGCRSVVGIPSSNSPERSEGSRACPESPEGRNGCFSKRSVFD